MTTARYQTADGGVKMLKMILYEGRGAMYMIYLTL